MDCMEDGTMRWSSLEPGGTGIHLQKPIILYQHGAMLNMEVAIFRPFGNSSYIQWLGEEVFNIVRAALGPCTLRKWGDRTDFAADITRGFHRARHRPQSTSICM